jgi:hypothetical protein
VVIDLYILKIIIYTSITNDPKLSSPAQIKQYVYQLELKKNKGVVSNYLKDEIMIILLIPEWPSWMLSTF